MLLLKIISQAPSLELTRSKPAHIPPIDRFSQEDIGDDIATEREISPVQVTGGHSNPLNDKTAEEHKRVSEYNLSFAIDVPVEANTSPVISANEASPRHLVASPSPQPCGPQVEAIVASHECIASRSSGSYNLTPCSVRIKNMYSSAKPTPSEDCPVSNCFTKPFLTLWCTVLSGAEERVAEERPGCNFQIF